MGSLDIDTIRKDFPALQQTVNGKPLVYLDSAATTLKPQQVVSVLERFYALEASNVHRGAHFLSDQATFKYEGAREKIAKFINAPQVGEVVFNRGTTEAINMVAQSYAREHFRPGDEIIFTEMEHHSNIVPWHLVAQQRDLVIKTIPVTDRGELDLEVFEKLLTEKTKLVSVTYCSNTLGTINPIKQIAQMAHSAGAKVLVDAAQAMSALKVDVQDLDCDFLAFSGHKMFGPFGIGVLWGRMELLDKMPPYQGGGSMIEDVYLEKSTYLAPPQRFEAGTPHIAGVIGLSTAVDYIESLGIENIYDHEKSVLDEATAQLKQIPGMRLIGEAENKVNILSFVIDGIHPSDIGQLLDQQGIAVRSGHHCTQPLMRRFAVPGTVRASFSVYNSSEDVSRLEAGIMKVKEFF